MQVQRNNDHNEVQDVRCSEIELEALIIGDDQFKQLGEEFHCFCPFEALGIVGAEVRHGTFLAYLLDPLRPHGFGSKVLRALLVTAALAAREVETAHACLGPLDVHLLDLSEAEIRREWRNIDLVIVLEAPKIVVVIELKVGSFQGPDQLARYRATTEETWPGEWRRMYILLTVQAEEPNDGDFWIPLGFSQLIPELETLVDAPGADPIASVMLKAYVSMLRRHHLSNERLEAIARKLWAEHGEALAFLADRRPDALASVFSALREKKEEIAREASTLARKIVPDSDYPHVVRFAIEAWDALPAWKTSSWSESKRLILLEIKREGERVSGVLYLGPGTGGDRERYAELLKAKRLHRPNARVGGQWMCLAKHWLYEPRKNEEFDADATLKLIRKEFKGFVQKVIDHFDPLLMTSKSLAHARRI